MKAISKLAALRLDHYTKAQGAGFSYRRCVARQRSLFAAPSVDLLTLVIAEAIKRKDQAKNQPEIQREVLRDAIVEIPFSPERGHDRGLDIDPSDPDEDA